MSSSLFLPLKSPMFAVTQLPIPNDTRTVRFSSRTLTYDLYFKLNLEKTIPHGVSSRGRDGGHRRARLCLLSQLHFRLSLAFTRRKFRETGSTDWNIGFVPASDAVGWSRAKRSRTVGHTWQYE